MILQTNLQIQQNLNLQNFEKQFQNMQKSVSKELSSYSYTTPIKFHRFDHMLKTAQSQKITRRSFFQFFSCQKQGLNTKLKSQHESNELSSQAYQQYLRLKRKNQEIKDRENLLTKPTSKRCLTYESKRSYTNEMSTTNSKTNKFSVTSMNSQNLHGISLETTPNNQLLNTKIITNKQKTEQPQSKIKFSRKKTNSKINITLSASRNFRIELAKQAYIQKKNTYLHNLCQRINEIQ